MDLGPKIPIGPFRLDLVNRCLWKGKLGVPLRAKPLAVLQYLVAHAGRVISTERLKESIWAGSHVSNTVLKVCIREIRVALGDKAKKPQFIETIPTRGYRFIGPGTTNGSRSEEIPAELAVHFERRRDSRRAIQ